MFYARNLKFRHRFGSFLKNSGGFTLIELMVVVGIIGILVSVTVPQYRKYRNRALQSEAKIALASVYTLEKSFYGEYGAYIASFDAIGYSPEGFRRYYDVVLTSDHGFSGTVTGYSGVTTTQFYSAVNVPFPLTVVYNNYACSVMASTGYTTDSQVFVVYAEGNFGTAYDDVWQINQSKVLKNCALGI